MYGLFAHTPGWVVLLVFMLVPAAVAVGVHAVVRALVPPEKLLPHHDVAGFLVAVVGVLYAVVLGFLVISVWSGFDQAQRNADAEANDASDILYLMRTEPDETRRRERRLLTRYAYEVRDVEWPMLAQAQEDLHARALMVAALQEIASAQVPPGTPETEAQRLATLRTVALESYRSLAAHRRLRILDAYSHVQPTLYFTIAAGGLILLTFVYLFGVQNRTLQFLMTALVAAMIGLMIGVIFELDRPYWGALHVSPDAWTLVIQDNRLGEP